MSKQHVEKWNGMEKRFLRDHVLSAPPLHFDYPSFPTLPILDMLIAIHSIAEYENLQLKDLVTLATIGIGGFGRVVLVKHYTKDTALNIFALKQMKKVHILETKQEEHVFNERKIMLACKCGRRGKEIYDHR
jgi:hypothetical protein